MMKISRFIKSASILIIVAAMMSCESDYTKMVKAELAKGIRQDSLLLGISFGNTREEFYGKCFDLNRQKLVTQGVGFSVQYMIKDSLQQPPRNISMLFYPTFDTLDIIKGMDIEFRYPGWNPNIRELQSDSLENHVKKLLLKWYKGNDFVTAHFDKKDTPVKVDANRRIILFVEDEQRILVHVQDLLHPDYRHKSVAVNGDMERNSR